MDVYQRAEYSLSDGAGMIGGFGIRTAYQSRCYANIFLQSPTFFFFFQAVIHEKVRLTF